jgi:2-polyprenyl-3-methyl-5-hydroxy-6-metoxy-1,4-benzoquinol methylase
MRLEADERRRQPMRSLKEIYLRRFSQQDADTKDLIWRELTAFLQEWIPIPLNGRVLDLACDRGDFIRHVKARERWASDMRDVADHLPPDVHFIQANGLDLAEKAPRGSFDVVFMSNYLEHLQTSEVVVRQLEVARRLIKVGGRVVVLQPNIRLVGGRYWDFIDHQVALTDRSLVEAAELAGLRTAKVIPRFIPYTTKSWLPQHRLLVRAYLRFPPIWWVLGGQSLYSGAVDAPVAEDDAGSTK